jgi:hypothetical protein
MLVSGVWHGAGWQFVVWGLLHGTYLTINQTWRLVRPRFWPDQKSYERVMKPVGFVLTFTSVAVALVFFRANSVSDALEILGGMFGFHGIAPYPYQVIQHLGFPFDWTIMWTPLTGVGWIIALFGAVTLLPNSLELLRRFQPALDFAVPTGTPVGQPPAPLVDDARSGGGEQRPASSWGMRRVWAVLERLGHADIPLSRLTATIMGLLFVLGVLAMSRAGGFLYGQF